MISDFKAQGTIIGITVVVIVAVVALIGFNVFTQLNADIQSSDSFSNISKENLQESKDSYPETLDTIVMASLLGLLIAGVFSAMFARYNVALGFITVFILIATLVVPMLFSNVWEDLTDDPNINYKEEFPLTNFVMHYFPFIWVGYILMIGLGYVIGDRIT